MRFILFVHIQEELQSMLRRISEVSTQYGGDINAQLGLIIENLCVLQLRKKDTLVGAYVEHRRFSNGDDSFDVKASELMSEMSMKEQAKYDKQTTTQIAAEPRSDDGGISDVFNIFGKQKTNAKGDSKKDGVSLSISKFSTYFVITILLACKGPLLTVKTKDRPSRWFKSDLLPETGRKSLLLTRSYIDDLLFCIPPYLKTLSRTRDAGFRADITWTPDRVDAGDQISEIDMKTKWPTTQML
jgi:hypothetical protein